MCGIAGFQGSFGPDLLERMNEAQAHRGPDDQGVWSDPEHGIGLAHRRLAILDPTPRGRQPMRDETGDLALVYNGEIYNFRELRDELAADGFAFRTGTDTEVLLKLWRRDGADAVRRLNGIFAFAVWDRTTRELTVVRDGMGVKPLYYAEAEDGFLFASELKALLPAPGLDRTLDPETLHCHLTYLWAPGGRTMLRGVRKLPPGEALRVKGGRVVRRWRHYDLPYDQPIRTVSEADAVEELRAHLARAVERQLVSDVPVGAFLSGGLDSSAVVAFARQARGGDPVPCFTIGTEDETMRREGSAEDLPYAKRVAESLGAELHVIPVGPQMVDELEETVHHLDEPQADLAPISIAYIARRARELGVKVLLGGAGGDDILTGYRRHYALLREAAWQWLPRPARAGMRMASGWLPTAWPPGRRIRRAFRYADRSADERLTGYFHWPERAEVLDLYTPRMREVASGLPFSPGLEETLCDAPAAPRLHRMLYLEARHFLGDHNLNYTDKLSMAHGVEVRVPLLDPDLVAFAASLPPGLKQHGATGKYVFKRAMETILPREVIYRPKTGFGPSVRYWLRNRLRTLARDVLLGDSLARRDLFDREALRRLLDANDRGMDYGYTILSILCIELWCRRFLDAGSRAG